MKQLNSYFIFLDDSLANGCGDDSTCSSSFHIDSPPSTAEFCQYFHAASSSSYYKNAIETGFSQLTLTDDEQRELYEAALVIQNAYRRYIQRKKETKNKQNLDGSGVESNFDYSNQIQNPIASKISYLPYSVNNNSLSRSSSTSLSSLTSSNSLRSNSLVKESPNMLMQSDSNGIPLHKNMFNFNINQTSAYNQDNQLQSDAENTNFRDENKQYQAACIIQKYYRRYKQYENLHKYTEAAVKIQTRYRMYKSMSPLSKGYNLNPYQHLSSSIDENIENDHSDNQFSNPKKQKQISRKLVNIRQSARFCPSSPQTSVSSSSNSNQSLTNNIELLNLTPEPPSKQQIHHAHYFQENNGYDNLQQIHQITPQLFHEDSRYNSLKDNLNISNEFEQSIETNTGGHLVTNDSIDGFSESGQYFNMIIDEPEKTTCTDLIDFNDNKDCKIIDFSSCKYER